MPMASTRPSRSVVMRPSGGADVGIGHRGPPFAVLPFVAVAPLCGEPIADAVDGHGPAHFIRANTKLLPVPLVPEIRLHIAEESVPIWQKTEEELGAMNVPPPYWAFAWAGGQALARYLLDNPALVAGRRVLDLGSGSGLVAIAAAKAGAARVLAADIDALRRWRPSASTPRPTP